MLSAQRADPHIVPLDGLRGIAVLMVMFGHFWLGQKPATAADEAVFTFVQNGWMGVDLFFVLSGFLITGILLEAKGSSHYFRNFYARRILRIFPLYWGFLFAYFVILPLFLHAGSPFTADGSTRLFFWLYGSNLLSLVKGASIPPGLNHFWTLAIEEQFYMIWPAIVFALSTKTLKRVCIALVFLAFAFRALLFGTAFQHTGGFVLTPARIDTLAIGAWLAATYFEGTHRKIVEKVAPAVFVSCLLALVAFNLPDLRLAGNQVKMQTFGFPLLAVMGACAVAIAASGTDRPSRLRRFLSVRPLTIAGKYSYAMYVFHLPISVALGVAGIGIASFPLIAGSGIPAALAYSLLATVLTGTAALISWHLYEKHFLRLKRFFPRRDDDNSPAGLTPVGNPG